MPPSTSRPNRRVLLALVAALGLVAALLSASATAATASSPTHKWRFDPTINAPWAAEPDETALDTATAAAGLCRSNPFDTTSAYGPLGSNVDVIVNDPVNPSGFSNLGCTTAQNETTVAVNPTNPQNIVAGANDYRVCCDFTGLNDGTGWAYSSFDGGKTWTNVQLPGLTAETGGKGSFAHLDSAGDPVVTFAPDGTVYYANIVFSRVAPASGIVVSRSTDGGKTWSAPSMASYNGGSANFFNDKEWIAAGPDGTVVVTWTRFNQGPQGAGFLASPIVGVVSRDGGKTWNRQTFPVSDAAHPYDQGSQVAFGPDGALYVGYEGASPSTSYSTDALVLARSTDLGRTWTTKEVARVYDDLDCYPVYAGRQTLTDMHFRLNSYPSMSIDPSTGRIALAWADDQGAGSCGAGGASFSGTTSNQVKLVQDSWSTIDSAPVTRVTTSGPDKVFPAVAAAGGKVAVTYYTRDYAISSAATVCNLMTIPDPAGITPVATSRSVCLDYAAKTSTDGFAGQIRLSSQSSNPFIQFANGSFIGDYSQVALGSDGVAHPAWTDFRGNPGVTPANQDVMTQLFTP